MEESSNGHRFARCCTGFYALVSYIPEPLGSFLNNLRAEMVSGCHLRSHVTLLPPRRLAAPAPELLADLDARLPSILPFELTLADVTCFETTNVIYLNLGPGRQEVVRIHKALSTGVMEYAEPFPFHPHITLAQELTRDEVPELMELARRRWAEFRGERKFLVDQLAFVQNVCSSEWQTLRDYNLQPAILPQTA